MSMWQTHRQGTDWTFFYVCSKRQRQKDFGHTPIKPMGNLLEKDFRKCDLALTVSPWWIYNFTYKRQTSVKKPQAVSDRQKPVNLSSVEETSIRPYAIVVVPLSRLHRPVSGSSICVFSSKYDLCSLSFMLALLLWLCI